MLQTDGWATVRPCDLARPERDGCRDYRSASALASTHQVQPRRIESVWRCSELRPADAHDVPDLRDGPTLVVAEDSRSFVLRELRCFDDLIAFGSSGEG
jgi:hypothetical protein